jgi:hypothetical protein
VLRVLIRAEQLYSARIEASKILREYCLIDRAWRAESLLWRIMLDDSLQRLSFERIAVIREFVQLLSHTLTDITIF